ncbi:hypothetical protein RB2150_00360 [Rhodobacterales bacterium HTCC2150]|nr:hypothetical protein RB2150_00360 [Rhodobacterales bacterium HTCC2150] [Rhodobacteraceae bacterium HTCC2150]
MHFTFGGVTYDPTPIDLVGDPTADPVDYGDSHGTSVAGLIGSTEGNGIGGVGMAWGVSLTGVNFLSDIQFESNTVISAAIQHAANFDIMNNSWGITPLFGSYQNLTNPFAGQTLVNNEYEYVVENGRGGLGTIIVQASGNDTLNANGDALNASRFTVSMAATDGTGFAAIYSNYGSNILVTAPAGSVTTDLVGANGYDDTGDYTDTFGGTSAATPVTSGVIALMLEANPGLGWRDVQNILAISASHTGSAFDAAASGFEQGTWFETGSSNWNGGGNMFHLSYGFGMVDAFAAVRMAEAWGIMFDAAATSVNEQHVSMTSGTINMGIVDETTSTNDMLVTSDLNIEQIMVTIDFTHTYSGALEIYLIAPDGTRFMLHDVNFNVDAADSGLEWTFGVTGALDMSSLGSWTLEVTDTDAWGDTGTVYDWTLDFYGSASSTDDVHHFTGDFFALVALDASRGLIEDTNGGIDWLNFSVASVGLQINLDAKTINATGVAETMIIGATSEIENVMAGDGNDLLTGDALANEMHGMRGDDTLNGGAGKDSLFGGVGHDDIYGGFHSDKLYGDDNNDLIYGGVGNDFLYGGADTDSLYGDEGNDKLYGGQGNDFFYGGDGFDKLFGGTENDRLYGDLKNDKLYGQDGLDKLYGGDGNDVMFGGSDADSIYGGDAEDKLFGNGDVDLLVGGSGNDKLYGHAGNDMLYGGGNDDTLFGGNHNDLMYGGNSADSFFGGAGNDEIYGDDGNDNLKGQAGSDTLDGGAHNDELFGGGDNDTLTGGTGDDTMSGGSGSDTFIFADGFGTDIITDFNATNNAEKIDLSGVSAITDYTDLTTLANNHIAQVGLDVVISDGTGDTITLTGVTLGNLGVDDFIFV